MNILKRLTYRPEFVKLVRVLGLRRIGRKLYYYWARPRDGILHLKVGNISVQFYIHTPEELRMLGKAGSGHWEQHVLEFLITYLRPGDVVYDIGSSVGLYSIFLAKIVGDQGKVFAFEPEYRSYNYLQDNLKLNGLTNVRALRLALGEYNGEGKLYVGEDLLFSNLIKQRGYRVDYQMIQVVRGDDFRKTENLPVPRAIKIDVEGYEYAVIRGLQRTLSDPTCELISLEVHPTLLPLEVQTQEIVNLLKSLGFNRLNIHRWRAIPEYHILAYKVKEE